MKAVLLSINPQHCFNIAKGQKTIEIRKNKPKINAPFKVYIYCTKGETLYRSNSDGQIRITKPNREKALQHHTVFNGKVIGEFICNTIDDYIAEFTTENCYEAICVQCFDKDCEETQEKFITSNEFCNPSNCCLCKQSCLSFDEIKKYVFNGESGFFNFCGWRMSDLLIYDKPQDLNCFDRLRQTKFGYEPVKLVRPPQSWCYVREEEINVYRYI